MKTTLVISLMLSVVPLCGASSKLPSRDQINVAYAIPKPIRYIAGGALAGYGASWVVSAMASSRLSWAATGAGLGAYAYYKADEFALTRQRYYLALNVAMNMKCVETAMRQQGTTAAAIVDCYAHIKPETALEDLVKMAAVLQPNKSAGKSTVPSTPVPLLDGSVAQSSAATAAVYPILERGSASSGTAESILRAQAPSPKSASATGGMGVTKVVADHFNGAQQRA